MNDPEPAHPLLATDEELSREAAEAVDVLVAELQRGWDQQDADITDRSLAGDVLWGGPFGALVGGYEPLHEIHLRLKAKPPAGPSRYEVQSVLAPAPGVTIAHVRRVALSADGKPLDPGSTFSEVALYVLIRHEGAWWLAAGQNTPVRPGLSADGT